MFLASDVLSLRARIFEFMRLQLGAPSAVRPTRPHRILALSARLQVSEEVSDAAKGQKLWEVSEKLVGLA